MNSYFYGGKEVLKKAKYIIEFRDGKKRISLPFETIKKPDIKVCNLADIQMTGLKKPKLMLNMSGQYVVSLWEEKSVGNMNRCRQYLERFIQEGDHSIYLSENIIYIVQMMNGLGLMHMYDIKDIYDEASTYFSNESECHNRNKAILSLLYRTSFLFSCGMSIYYIYSLFSRV